jgi:hypothetical protein
MDDTITLNDILFTYIGTGKDQKQMAAELKFLKVVYGFRQYSRQVFEEFETLRGEEKIRLQEKKSVTQESINAWKLSSGMLNDAQKRMRLFGNRFVEDCGEMLKVVLDMLSLAHISDEIKAHFGSILKDLEMFLSRFTCRFDVSLLRDVDTTIAYCKNQLYVEDIAEAEVAVMDKETVAEVEKAGQLFKAVDALAIDWNQAGLWSGQGNQILIENYFDFYMIPDGVALLTGIMNKVDLTDPTHTHTFLEVVKKVCHEFSEDGGVDFGHAAFNPVRSMLRKSLEGSVTPESLACTFPLAKIVLRAEPFPEKKENSSGGK